MRISVSHFALPKAGNSDDEYEDACCPIYPNGERVRDRFRFGVADGASEGYLSRHWARFLVECFLRCTSLSFEDTFTEARKRWDAWLPEYLKERERLGRPIQWFDEVKLEQGAYATFLGIQMRSRRWDDRRGSWAAIALGDTCLFQVRDERLIEAFPVARAEQFNITPNLVPSKPSRSELVTRLARRTEGGWRHGDAFFFSTDALAAWFLAQDECHEAPWQILLALDAEKQSQFAEWVEGQRRRGIMRNDDVTLIRLQVE